MLQQISTSTLLICWLRAKAWVHQHTAPDAEIPPTPELTDADLIAAWTPVSLTRSGQLCFNPLLDLPLKPRAGMDKVKLWEMFVYRLVESEVRNILELERSWSKSLECSAVDSDTAGSQQFPPNDSEGSRNREAPLRLSDLAAAVIVWLWHNGLHHQAIGLLERIWTTTRDRQENLSPECIQWPAQSALEGFRAAAYRDWDDNDQAEFAALFRNRHVDTAVDREIRDLTKS